MIDRIYYYTFILIVVVSAKKIDEVWINTPNVGDRNSQTNPDVYNYYTNLSSYGIVPGSNKYIKFNVQACSNAHIVLSGSEDLVSSYMNEVVLGSRHNSLMYIDSSWKDANNIISCNIFKAFWISWESDTNIQVGQGDVVNSNILMDHRRLITFEIKGIGLSTSFGATGTWIIINKAVLTGHNCGQSDRYGDMERLKYLTVRSKVECSVHCYLSENCLGNNYNEATRTCELLASGQAVSSIPNPSWRFYSKCLQGRKACIACL